MTTSLSGLSGRLPRRMPGWAKALTAVVVVLAVLFAGVRLAVLPGLRDLFGTESHDRSGPALLKSIQDMLRGMIERLFWGQEKFDAQGGRPRSLDLASGAGGSTSKGNLRSLGTVEALLILTDWHPRNLHFPPGDDENTLLDREAQSHNRTDKDLDNESDPAGNRGSAEGRVAFQKWLEPAWRSDRMSWMLLSTAQALAFELGVFDHKTESKGAPELPSEQARKRRLRRLILVFITHSSGRLGIPSMLPLTEWGRDIPAPLTDSKDSDVDLNQMQDCWMGISKIVYQANHQLFASSEQTSELIRSGRYREQIDWFQPQLREFRQNLDRVNCKFNAARNVCLYGRRLTCNSVSCYAEHPHHRI